MEKQRIWCNSQREARFATHFGCPGEASWKPVARGRVGRTAKAKRPRIEIRGLSPVVFEGGKAG